MNKERFNKLVSDYSKLDGQFSELEKLVERFPYSQPLRMLNAKSSSSLSKVEFQQRLGLAAFYSTDRNVLRSLIETGQVPSDSSAPQPQTKKISPKVSPKVVSKSSIKPQGKAQLVKPGKVKIDAEQLRKEVLVNLDHLLKAKAEFQKLSDLDDLKKTKSKGVKKQPTAEKEAVKVTSKKVTAKKQVAKAATSPKRIPRNKKEELIDKFIAEEPSITPNKATQENQSDLSRASSELKEDLVSENLAVIFASQGKKAKAIEIYKKLIWKFPQKKASFAARIEELKKK